ncbi:MAG: hypothetical protein M3494_12315 [Actinomycetota bacterium]|nr:hypothetical protein [Rubrobacter sp.]MDQ3508781.1 hypothetical protein [Actinomycetota bacterium]
MPIRHLHAAVDRRFDVSVSAPTQIGSHGDSFLPARNGGILECGWDARALGERPYSTEFSLEMLSEFAPCHVRFACGGKSRTSADG